MSNKAILDILYRIEADSKGLIKDLKAAERAASNSTNSIKRDLKSVDKSMRGVVDAGKALAGAFVFNQVLSTFKNLTSEADKIGKAADRLGVSTDGFQKLSFAAGLAGTNIEQLEASFRAFSTRAGQFATNPQLQQAFADIGVDPTSGKPIEEIFLDASKAVAKIEDPIKRATVAARIFGEEGGNRMALLGKSVAAAGDEFNNLGIGIPEEFIRNSETLNDNFSKLTDAFKSGSAELAGPLVEGLIEFTNRILAGVRATKSLEASILAVVSNPLLAVKSNEELEQIAKDAEERARAFRERAKTIDQDGTFGKTRFDGAIARAETAEAVAAQARLALEARKAEAEAGAVADTASGVAKTVDAVAGTVEESANAIGVLDGFVDGLQRKLEALQGIDEDIVTQTEKKIAEARLKGVVSTEQEEQALATARQIQLIEQGKAKLAELELQFQNEERLYDNRNEAIDVLVRAGEITESESLMRRKANIDKFEQDLRASFGQRLDAAKGNNEELASIEREFTRELDAINRERQGIYLDEIEITKQANKDFADEQKKKADELKKGVDKQLSEVDRLRNGMKERQQSQELSPGAFLSYKDMDDGTYTGGFFGYADEVTDSANAASMAAAKTAESVSMLSSATKMAASDAEMLAVKNTDAYQKIVAGANSTLAPISGVSAAMSANAMGVEQVSVKYSELDATAMTVSNNLASTTSNVAQVMVTSFDGAFRSIGAQFQALGDYMIGGLQRIAYAAQVTSQILEGLIYRQQVAAQSGSFGAPSISVPGYANGGVVTQPTLAMIGEGAYSEAVVPLPDGRSIPVDLKGAGGGGMVNVNINNMTGANVRTQERMRNGVREFDVFIEEIESAMGENIRRGQGLATAIENNYQLGRRVK